MAICGTDQCASEATAVNKTPFPAWQGALRRESRDGALIAVLYIQSLLFFISIECLTGHVSSSNAHLSYSRSLCKQ